MYDEDNRIISEIMFEVPDELRKYVSDEEFRELESMFRESGLLDYLVLRKLIAEKILGKDVLESANVLLFSTDTLCYTIRSLQDRELKSIGEKHCISLYSIAEKIREFLHLGYTYAVAWGIRNYIEALTRIYREVYIGAGKKRHVSRSNRENIISRKDIAEFSEDLAEAWSKLSDIFIHVKPAELSESTVHFYDLGDLLLLEKYRDNIAKYMAELIANVEKLTRLINEKYRSK